jgi:SAM-dependent methyltransferase
MSSEEVLSVAATEAGSERRDALVGRLFASTVGAFELLGVYVGSRLGLYEALASHGPLTSAELAEAAGIAERYAREWLELQAAAEIVDVDDPSRTASERRYSLPAGHDEALTDMDSLNYAAPFGQFVVAALRPIDALLDAIRTGDGVPFADYGADLHDGQAAFTRPLFRKLLTQEWLPAVPELHERLLAEPPARLADVACGLGWSSIAMAEAYPLIQVDGIDLDVASIEKANELLATRDVGGRVTFEVRDAADLGLQGRYDVVTVFEALHDMSYPVHVLRACRGLLAEGGAMLVADERVSDEFTLPASDIERFYYGISLLHCLPVGMIGEGAAGTGTVMRASTVERYASEAGFGSFDVLPIENDFWRFYLLRP